MAGIVRGSRVEHAVGHQGLRVEWSIVIVIAVEIVPIVQDIARR